MKDGRDERLQLSKITGIQVADVINMHRNDCTIYYSLISLGNKFRLNLCNTKHEGN